MLPQKCLYSARAWSVKGRYLRESEKQFLNTVIRTSLQELVFSPNAKNIISRFSTQQATNKCCFFHQMLKISFHVFRHNKLLTRAHVHKVKHHNMKITHNNTSTTSAETNLIRIVTIV